MAQASNTNSGPHPWANRRVMVVGAGFTGAVIARELADAGVRVDVLEAREHVAGHAHDELNEHGIRVHRYGPHLFHTSDMKVVDWLSRFCQWMPYQHRVKALLADGRYVTLPVNRETASIVGSDQVINTFFRPYTRKMWGKEIEELDPSILARVPIRDDLNELYFPQDSFQALPEGGYTAMVQRILDHPGIQVTLNTRFVKGMEADHVHCFNCMPIDEFFDYSLGELPYRSIRFHTQTIPVPTVLPVATVNFTHDGPYTRVTEWKKLPGHGDAPWVTTLTTEEPCDYRDNHMQRFYPVKDAEGHNRALVQQYRSRVGPNMTFVGRCGTYAYLDMHQAVSHALAAASRTWAL